jgi:hypothetical protein
MLNLLYNLINLVLTEDQSDRPISDLEVEMSEATNMRVVSFAHDLIYDVTRKVQTPARVGLAIRTKLIKLYNKFGMVTDCSFIKLPVEGNGTDDLASDKVNLRIAFTV